jgi:hypothetical protein
MNEYTKLETKDRATTNNKFGALHLPEEKQRRLEHQIRRWPLTSLG